MLVGRVGKATFHQMFSPPPIGSCRGAVGLRAPLFQQFLGLESLDASAVFGLRATGAQRARGANALVRHVLPSRFLRPVLMPMQPLTRRTTVAVAGHFILKVPFRIESLSLAGSFLRLLQVGHVGAQSPLLASHEVLHGAIGAVGDHRDHGLLRVVLVLLDQPHQLGLFLDRAACGHLRRDHSVGVVHDPVQLVAGA